MENEIKGHAVKAYKVWKNPNLGFMEFIITTVLILLFSIVSNAQTLNTESAKAFWQIVDTAKANKPISDSLWSFYRNQEANKIWFGMAIKLDKNYEPYYRKAIELVFMPSNKQLLDSILALPKDAPRSLLNIFIVGMYKNYFMQELKIRLFYKKIAEPGYLDTVYQIAATMLPKHFVKPSQKINDLKIYVHGIENGANAGRHGIIFSMAGLYNFEKDNLGILGAHELHHILRVSKIKDSINDADKYAVDIMESCLNEGSADILNNLPVIEKTGFEELKERTLKDCRAKLATIDNWFLASANDTSNKKTQDEVNQLFDYLSGHNPGYFMAFTIVKNGFKNELRETVDNPFHFFLLYQKAAKKDNEHRHQFSKKTISYIKKLEKKYWGK